MSNALSFKEYDIIFLCSSVNTHSQLFNEFNKQCVKYAIVLDKFSSQYNLINKKDIYIDREKNLEYIFEKTKIVVNLFKAEEKYVEQIIEICVSTKSHYIDVFYDDNCCYDYHYGSALRPKIIILRGLNLETLACDIFSYYFSLSFDHSEICIFLHKESSYIFSRWKDFISKKTPFCIRKTNKKEVTFFNGRNFSKFYCLNRMRNIENQIMFIQCNESTNNKGVKNHKIKIYNRVFLSFLEKFIWYYYLLIFYLSKIPLLFKLFLKYPKFFSLGYAIGFKKDEYQKFHLSFIVSGLKNKKKTKKKFTLSLSNDNVIPANVCLKIISLMLLQYNESLFLVNIQGFRKFLYNNTKYIVENNEDFKISITNI